MNENQKPILLQDLGMKLPKETSKRKYRYGLYKCFCGKEFKAQIQYVNIGNTTSCGCYKRERMRNLNKSHNMKNHRLYGTWSSMMTRCYNNKRDSYKYYGGRGIKVCERWLNVENFINDMYPSFIEGLTLDRINVDGNYEPNNCRWVTNEVQARNTRRININNKTGYRGVSLNRNKYKKYSAYICVDNKQIFLGTSSNSIECAKAYDKYITDNNLEHTKNFN